MNSVQKLIAGIAGVAALGFGAWSVLGGSTAAPTDDGSVGFTSDELERVDEDLADLEAEDIPDNLDAQRETVVDAAPAAAIAAGEDRAILELEGRVVDTAGKPVPKAEVSLYMRRSLEALFRNGGARGRRFGGNWRTLFQLRKVAKSVTTRADGRFAFRGPAFTETSLRIAVRHAGFAPTVASKDWASKQGKLSVGDIVVNAGGTVFGTVYSKSGAPLGNADVSYKLANDRGRRGRRGRGGFRSDDTLEKLVPAVKTDEHGAFELRNLPAGGFELAVTLAKYLPGRTSRFEMKPEARIDAGRTELELGAELTGTVKDRDGRPIARAVIEATASREAFFALMRGRTGNNRRGRNPDFRRFGQLAATSQKTKTDSTGRFVLDALPVSGVRLSVKHPGFIDEERDPIEPAKTKSVEITMFKRIVVSGVVIDQRNGKPVEVYAIKARRTDGGFGRGPGGMFGRNRGRGGNRGRDNRGRGDRGRGNRGRGDRGRGDRGRGDRGRGDRGRGNEQRNAERANQRANAEAQRNAQRTREVDYRKARLGPSGEAPRRAGKPGRHTAGRFILEGLQPGKYVFDIESEGYARTAAGPLQLERGKTVAQQTFRLERGSRLEGTVFDKQTGKPIAGARLELSLPPLDANPSRDDNPFARLFRSRRGGRNSGLRVDDVRSDKDGRFRFGSYRPGRFRLSARADERMPYVDDNLILPAGRDVTGLKVMLSSGGRIAGTVQHLEQPDGARVRLRHEKGDQVTARVENGRYVAKGLMPGGWFVTLDEGGTDFGRRGAQMFRQLTGSNAKPDVFVTEGSEAKYDIDAARVKPATVTGTVFDNGAPSAAFEAALSMQDEPSTPGNEIANMVRRFSGRLLRDGTNEQGAFKIENVPAGNYVLEVRARSGRGGRRGGGGSVNPALERIELTLSPGQVWQRDFQFTTGQIEFNVQDSKGKPASGVRVQIALANEAGGKKPEQWKDLPSQRTVRLRNGVGRAEGLPIGTWIYRVTGKSIKSKTGRVYVSAGEAGPTQTVEVEAKPAEPKQPKQPPKQGQAAKKPPVKKG